MNHRSGALHSVMSIIVSDITANLFYKLNADNNDKDRIHSIYGYKHYDAPVGIYHGNCYCNLKKKSIP